MIRSLRVAALAVVLALAATAAAERARADELQLPPAETILAQTPAHARSESPGPTGLTRRDLWFGIGTLAGVAIAAPFDERIKDAFPNTSGKGKRLADAVRPLGSTTVVGGTLLLGWGACKLFHNEQLGHAAVRSGISLVAAGVVALGAKVIVGRSRPRDEPNDPSRFQPFSGNASFPSGHATISMAAATALSRETKAAWVPFVAYPAAALVGWSRLRDNEHWLSDVIGGFAVGYWVTDRTEDFLRARWGNSTPFGVTVTPGDAGPMLGMNVKF